MNLQFILRLSKSLNILAIRCVTKFVPSLSLLSARSHRVDAARSLSLLVQARLFDKGLKVVHVLLTVNLIQVRLVRDDKPPLLSQEGLSGKGCLTVLQAT